MTLNELKDYLRMVVNMESERYFQRQLKDELTRKLNALSQPMPINAKKPVDYSKSSFAIFWASLPYFFVGAVLSLVPALAIGVLWGDSWTWTTSAVKVKQWFLFWAIGGGLLIASLMAGDELYRKNKEQEAYHKAMQQYQKEMTFNELRIQKEAADYIFLTAFYKRELAVLEKQIQRSEQCLQTLYGANIIHPKYREFTRVCSLYEYFDTGRCWSLEKTSRDEGAYNILEREILAKAIILQLERIISRLDEIRDNQHELYAALQRTNQRITVIIAENNQLINQWSTSGAYRGTAEHQVETLLKGSKLSEYINERAKIELSYLKRLQSY